VSGREHLDEALEEGKGVILLANHFGSHVVISHWMFRQGYPLRWFGEQPRNVSTYLKEKLRSDGPLGQDGLFVSRRTPMSEAAGLIVRLARILSAGMIVKIACDVRWRGGKVASGSFLGWTETFTTAWVQLAARTGAAVVPVYCRLDEQGIYHLTFHPAHHVPPEAARPGGDAPWLQGALDDLEEEVRRHPEQSNDYFFWTADDPRIPGAPKPTRPRSEPSLVASAHGD
jgi:KDO2-lipid IV(A) lauroyltransferase